MEPKDRIIVALDYDEAPMAWELVETLDDLVFRYKVGHRLLTGAGLQFVDELIGRGKWVFCDLKLLDIPSVVEGAVHNLAIRRVGALTLHALGGDEMLRAGVQACHGFSPRPQLWAVTVLTSLTEETLKGELYVTSPLPDYIVHLARLARFCGCDGVIASGKEVGRIKEACGDDFIVVVPSVRPSGAETHDQRRPVTPGEAIRQGADFLVVGRFIREADDPIRAFLRIAEEVAKAL